MSSVFYPPNCQRLSDAVIGHVKERSDRRSDPALCSASPDGTLVRPSCSSSGTSHFDSRFFSDALDECFVEIDDPASSTWASMMAEGQRGNVPTNESPDSSSSLEDSRHPTGHHQNSVLPAKALDKEAIRRKRNRESMARARKKMKENEMALGQDCERLRQEIRTLQRQINSPRASSLTKMTSWKVAAEYCRLSRNGLTSFLAAPEPYNTSAALCQYDCRVFQDFLSVVMAPDVLGERGRGIELLIDDWKWISSNLPDMKIELVRLEEGPGHSLIAATKDKFTITEDMLRRAFPLVVDGSLATLGAKLIGKQFEMRGTVAFEWDDKSDRIVGLKYKGDMITPLLKLLGSLEAVSRVFDSAFLTPECKLAGKAYKCRFRGSAL